MCSRPQVIANHITPCISFATGGDSTEYDMIGYVAKDARNVREVHVFDCGHMAHDVIATIGQAFELRFKAFLQKQGVAAPGVGGVSNAMYRLQQGVPQPVYDDAELRMCHVHTMHSVVMGVQVAAVALTTFPGPTRPPVAFPRVCMHCALPRHADLPL